MECIRCLMDSRFPGVELSEDGLCNICHQEEVSPPDYEKLNLLTLDYLRDLETRHSTAVLGLSGGKDSCASLVWLRRHCPGLNIRAVSVDNGFLSRSALANAERVVSRAGVPWEVIDAPLPKEAMDAVSRGVNYCVPCAHSYVRVLAARAIEMGCGTVILGREWLYAFDETANRIVHYDPVHDSEPYTGLKGISIVRLVAALGLSIRERMVLLEGSGWVKPDLPSNTNCLLLGLIVHKFAARHGYHPFILPLSEQVRRGLLTAEEARVLLKDRAISSSAWKEFRARFAELYPNAASLPGWIRALLPERS